MDESKFAVGDIVTRSTQIGSGVSTRSAQVLLIAPNENKQHVYAVQPLHNPGKLEFWKEVGLWKIGHFRVIG
jgi:hypothetical protein